MNVISTTARSRGLTVLELLVALGVLSLILALLLPAVVSAREAARRVTCKSHLREIGIAIQQHHDAVRRLPRSWTMSPDGISGFGWAVELLPLLGGAALDDAIDCKFGVGDVANDVGRRTVIPLMLCPSDIAEPMFDLLREMVDEEELGSESFGFTPVEEPELLVELPTSNYVGVYGSIEADDGLPAPAGDGSVVSDRRVRLADLRRGTSNTLLVGERKMSTVPSTWFGVHFAGEDAACRLVGSALAWPNCEECDECEFSSRHPGGVNFLWADGHVSFVSEDIDPQEYQRLARRFLQ